MSTNYRLTYSVDVVFCVDRKKSMAKKLERVKESILSFYSDCTNGMKKRNKHITQFRARIIAFGDYSDDSSQAMMVTDFFKLPQQNEDFEKCVNSITAECGGDGLCDGIEALAYAIKSRWDTECMIKREFIVVCSDSATHHIGFGRNSRQYPKGMAKDLRELTEWWSSGDFIDHNAKRLLLFAPNEPDWNIISSNWDNVLHFPSQAGEDLQELEYEEILFPSFY